MQIVFVRLFEGRDEVFHAGDLHAVDLFHDEVAQAFVADGGGGGDGSAEENDALGLVLEFFGVLIGVEQVEGCAGGPILSECLEHGAGEFLENEAAFHKEVRRTVELVTGHEPIHRLLAGEGHGNFPRLAAA